MAMNAPIQGTAADIIKIAMRDVEDALHRSSVGKDTHLLLQVHDELIYEVKTEAVGDAAQIIQKAMEAAGGLSVPLAVTTHRGKRWGTMSLDLREV